MIKDLTIPSRLRTIASILTDGRLREAALSGSIRAIGIVAVSLALGHSLQSTPMWRTLIALVLTLLLLALIAYQPRIGYPAVVVYIALMGGVRHWLIPITGWPKEDPLLLVAPLVALAQVVRMLTRRSLFFDTATARLLLLLILIMVLEIFNPSQGGVTVGLAGAMLYLCPLAWYYASRMAATEPILERVITAVALTASAAAFYGLVQTWFGFLPSEQEWIKIGGYAALSVGVIRSFSSFSSASEYAHFLAIGLVICWALVLQRRWVAIFALPLIATALFLESARATVAAAVFGCAVLWAVQTRNPRLWLVRGLLALAIGAAGLVWSASEIRQASLDSRVNPLVQHQVSGLTDPLGRSSTMSGHVSRVAVGVGMGFAQPLGRGLGATTLAAKKYGDVSFGTEGDLSDMFVSLGFVGGLIYGAIYLIVLVNAFTAWRLSRSVAALSALGVLLVELNAWLAGSQYSTVILVWFCVGALDGLVRQHRQGRDGSQGASS